jgi:hypothetical protein
MSTGIRWRGIAVAAAAVLAIGVAVPAGAAPRRSAGWLGLAAGHVGDYGWTVEAKRPSGPAGAGQQGARRPCLLVGTVWQTSPYSFLRSRNRQCVGATGLSATDPPLVADGVQPSSGANARITVVGMIFPPAARRLRVTLPDGSRRTIHLDRLTPRKARRAGLEPFRYAAFAARGEWCAERLVSENAAGRVLWDSGTDGYACGSKGPPRFAARQINLG